MKTLDLATVLEMLDSERARQGYLMSDELRRITQGIAESLRLTIVCVSDHSNAIAILSEEVRKQDNHDNADLRLLIARMWEYIQATTDEDQQHASDRKRIAEQVREVMS